jgi:dienelactone hydrolase
LPSASEGKDSRAEALCATLLPVKKKKHTHEIVLLISLTSLTTIWGGFAIYCGFYYHALPEADSSLLSHDGVVVSSSKRLYSFVPEKPEILSYVFYPGGKVEAKAYAPFCFALAQKGNPVYLCVMPFNLAFFDSEAASRVIDNHEAERWVIVGHSLGGAFAGSYASAHASKLSGIVFLASYTTQDLSKTNLKSLSIYGSEDGVMNREKYNESLRNLPSDHQEIVLQGGNHASFGDYGEQSGDGKATITFTEQIQKSVDAIDSIFGN